MKAVIQELFDKAWKTKDIWRWPTQAQETLIHRLTEGEENISDNTVPEDSRQMVANALARHEQAWEGYHKHQHVSEWQRQEDWSRQTKDKLNRCISRSKKKAL